MSTSRVEVWFMRGIKYGGLESIHERSGEFLSYSVTLTWGRVLLPIVEENHRQFREKETPSENGDSTLGFTSPAVVPGPLPFVPSCGLIPQGTPSHMGPFCPFSALSLDYVFEDILM